MRGCDSTDQHLLDDKFTEPLPAVGLYVAGASLVCALAMFHDAINGIRKRKFWFPCSWFPLNATTLTLLGVAVKFTVDLNTPMPSHIDQLSKLTGTILICTVMGNFMPSLGNMKGSDLVSNVFALAILTITVVANISIQMGTGVIYVFWVEHIIVMTFMLLLLAIFVASALPVSTTKKILDDQFDIKYSSMAEEHGSEELDEYKRRSFEVEQYWLMAHTGNPQYVMGRSATCIASGAFCFLSAVVIIEAYARSHIHSSKVFCSGQSDYKWSTKVVFYSQAMTIAVGTFAPAYRWLNAISFRRLESNNCRCWKEEFNVEKYWTKKLKDLKDKPFPFNNDSRHRRKLVYRIKSSFLSVSVRLQQWVVVFSKLVRLLSIFLLRLLSICLLCWLPALKRWLQQKCPDMYTHRPIAEEEIERLRNCVLHLEGEEDLVNIITRSEQRDVKKWIDKGKKKKPNSLIRLIKKNSARLGGFGGVRILDSRRIVALGTGRQEPDSLAVDNWVATLVPKEYEPQNCWALPIVTLVSIAKALPHVSRSKKKSLLEEVYQGLKYVRFVEKYLEGRGLVNAREAADIIWKTIEIHGRWLDEDLNELSKKTEHSDGPAPHSSTCGMVIEELAKIGKAQFNKFWKKECKKENIRSHVVWPRDALAGHCMYKIAAGILADYRTQTDMPKDSNYWFTWIERSISDIIRACLTNIPRAIHLACISSSIEEREENVRNAAFVLGEAADDILPILAEQKYVIQLEENQRAYIDDWLSKIQERELP